MKQAKKLPDFKKKPIVEMVINTDNDASETPEMEEKWEDLDDLKLTISSSVKEMLTETFVITSDPVCRKVLGDRLPEFDRMTQKFLNEVDEFSTRFKELRETHEGLSGNVKTFEEHTKYSKIQITYINMMEELQRLVSLPMTEIVSILHEAECERAEKAEKEKQEEKAVDSEAQEEKVVENE